MLQKAAILMTTEHWVGKLDFSPGLLLTSAMWPVPQCHNCGIIKVIY